MWSILLICAAALTIQTALCQEDDDDPRGGPDLDPSTLYRHTLYNFRPRSLFNDDGPDEVGNEEGREDLEDEKYRSYSNDFNDFRSGGDRQSPRPRENLPLPQNRPHDPLSHRRSPPRPRRPSTDDDEDDGQDLDRPYRDRATLDRDDERDRQERVPLDRERPDQRKYYYGSTPVASNDDDDDDDKDPPPRHQLNPRELPPKGKNWKHGSDDIDNYGRRQNLPPKKVQNNWMDDIPPPQSRPTQSGFSSRSPNTKNYDDDRQNGKRIKSAALPSPSHVSPQSPYRGYFKPKERRWNSDVDENYGRGGPRTDETTKGPVTHWKDQMGSRGIVKDDIHSRKAMPMDPSDGASGGFVIMRARPNRDTDRDHRPTSFGADVRSIVPLEGRSRPRGPLLGRDPNDVKVKKPPMASRDPPHDAALHSVRNSRPRSRSDREGGGGNRGEPFSGPEDIPGEGAGIGIVVGAGRRGGGSGGGGGGPDRSNDDERDARYRGGHGDEEFQSVRKPWGALGQHHQHVTIKSSTQQQQQMSPPNQAMFDSKRVLSRPPPSRRRHRLQSNNDKPDFEVIRHYYK